MSVAEADLESGGRARGKGLGWSDVECLALCRAAAAVSQSSMLGAGMSMADYGRRIQKLFLRDERPVDACSQEGTGSALNQRRWDGRTAISCRKQWIKVKSACVGLHASMNRVRAANLTGAPTNDEYMRCVEAVHCMGSAVMSHLYDVINNPGYLIGKQFPFTTSYEFLSTKTTLLDCAGTAESRMSGSDGEDIEPGHIKVGVLECQGSTNTGAGNFDRNQDVSDLEKYLTVDEGNGSSSLRQRPQGHKSAMAAKRRKKIICRGKCNHFGGFRCFSCGVK
jgi:hypothetical protein